MPSLADLSNIVIERGDPVTPEPLNNPAIFAEEFHRVFSRGHRVSDCEHLHPAPDAAGTILWDGGGYSVSPGARNIAGVTQNAIGDVTVELVCAAASRDLWAPMAYPQGVPAVAWEVDDGTIRTATTCRIRLAEVTPVYEQGKDDTPPQPRNLSFRFEAYLYRRATGASGLGQATTGPVAHAVRNRIAVDGVESAEHRNKLNQFCGWLRGVFDADHLLESGEHRVPDRPGLVPLGVASWRDGEATSDPGRLDFKTEGAFESTSWQPGDRIAFQLAGYQPARWARGMIRYRSQTEVPNIQPSRIDAYSDGLGGEVFCEPLPTPVPDIQTNPAYRDPLVSGVTLVVYPG